MQKAAYHPEPFMGLSSFIRYKADTFGIEKLMRVDLKHTSQGGSRIILKKLMVTNIVSFAKRVASSTLI
ncbi:hypothetical protein [Nitrosococcus watsonii]|uniref:hypothetical protein n=1 Tax=Nitrosococcus watsonii TaxID=473531 RepID=UPI0002D5123A|nr:hypothetical protein [Nitrosococcus watsonii]